MSVPSGITKTIQKIRDRIKALALVTVLSSLAVVATGSAELNPATNSATLQIESAPPQTMVTPPETLALLTAKNKLEDQPVSNDEEFGIKKDSSEKFVENRLVIKFKDGVNDNDKKALVRQFGAKFIREDLDLSGGKVIYVNREKRDEAERTLAADTRVEYVHKDSLLQLGGGSFGSSGTVSTGGSYQTGPNCNPNDPEYCNGNQWALQAIGATAGWGFSKGSRSVTVAVIDTGLDTHRDTDTGRIILGKNYVNNTYDTTDENGHGTKVASIILARPNNALDIAPVNWFTRVLVAKADDGNGGGTVSTLVSAINDIVNNYGNYNVRVMNISLTARNDVEEPTLAIAIANANNHNILVVAGAKHGQDDPLGFNDCFIGFPAAYGSVTAVAALWHNGGSDYRLHSGCSKRVLNGVNYSGIDLSAPGAAIKTLYVGNDGANYVQEGYGTSFAAPFVSGTAAVLAACIPNSTPDKIKAALYNTAQPLGDPGYDTTYGYGMVTYGSSIVYNSYYQNCPPE